MRELLELGKQEAVSAVDTIKKSYGCYAGHGLKWFNIVQHGSMLFNVVLQFDVDLFAIEDIANCPHQTHEAQGRYQRATLVAKYRHQANLIPETHKSVGLIHVLKLDLSSSHHKPSAQAEDKQWVYAKGLEEFVPILSHCMMYFLACGSRFHLT